MPTHLNPPSHAPAPLPTDPQTLADIQHVLEHGFVILPSLLSPSVVAACNAELARLSGSTPSRGRNSFEGVATVRIYALLNKSRIFDELVVLPRVLALNEYFLSPGYAISAMHSIEIGAGERAQGLHHDDMFCDLSRPRRALGTAVVVALDGFGVENGATRIVAGSHKWGGRVPRGGDEVVSVECEAGSVVYFLGTTWHGGGENRSGRPRRSVTVQYCQPWVRPIENQFLAVDPRKLDEIPERIVDMMGYKVHKPFIGYVDGLSPRTAAKRMVQWLQKPADCNPPSFAHRGDVEEKSKL
ncbi:phytanoyl-CoA dioxygenase [Trichodelitschia bisporula]|uniref:Phytanoyl-CoA dioxygenase n=1 Tax=Trichodelitschia bisporula TaxID=703511 RepID=A0A6G1I6M5_9PEZI|nr:phytanoyl-CoA dioxygenase [Trichodelitschia bisporula]